MNACSFSFQSHLMCQKRPSSACVRFVVTPKPADVDEYLKPNTRPYNQVWWLVHIFQILRGAMVMPLEGCTDNPTQNLLHMMIIQGRIIIKHSMEILYCHIYPPLFLLQRVNQIHYAVIYKRIRELMSQNNQSKRWNCYIKILSPPCDKTFDLHTFP